MSTATKSLILTGLLLAAGVRCALWYAQAHTPDGCIERQPHALQIQIEQARRRPDATQLTAARVTDVRTRGCASLQDQRLRLTWYEAPADLAPGAVAVVEVKLRRPWGTRNPGGFDYGRWLIGQGYAASGYVKSVQAFTPVAEPSSPALISPHRFVHAGLLEAILLGRRGGVSDAHWALFRNTGTIHLMVVSGLHVSVFVGLIYVLCHAVLRMLPLQRGDWIPRTCALVPSLAAMAGFVHQTGAQPAVLRASLMATIVMLSLLLLRRVPWWRVLGLVALTAVAFQPQFLLQQGFWLSYAAAAALLFFFAPRRPRAGWIMSLLQCQCVLTILLTPWLGVTVGQVPTVGPLANLLVVPLVTLLTIPAGMLGVLLTALPAADSVARACLLVSDVSLAIVLHVLTKLQSQLPSVGFYTPATAVLIGVAGLTLTLPLNKTVRGLALLGWLPALLPNQAGVAYGAFRVMTLDVGQGSSAIVDTQHHRMLVDTGGAYPSGFSHARAVVIPALRATGPDRLDALLISHTDNDHAGGAAVLLARFPSARTVGLQLPCTDGETWSWDGVRFSVLTDPDGSTRNDRSCTLLVDNGRQRAFFSGDIGARTERVLAPRLPRAVDLLVAPHHGSAGSSSRGFVRRLAPQVVVFSAGRGNPYGHPDAKVLQRYRRIGARTLITGLSGAITWSSSHPRVATERRQARSG